MAARRSCIVVLGILLAAPCAADDAGRADDAYREELRALAEWCRERGLANGAARAASWFPPPSAKQTFFTLPIGGDDDADADSPRPTGDEAEFLRRFDELRRRRAERLFEQARSQAEAGRFSPALRLTYETLHEDPNHAAARKLLGYQQVDGRWRSPIETAKHRAGQIWHARFGWIAAEHIARYEQGERYLNGKWLAADEDARVHATIDRGWEVQTENFRIRTNHGLEEAARLAARLEAMQQVWRQLFARYHTVEAEWRRLFAGGEPRPISARRLPVVCFRTRDEYVSALRKREPRIEQTSGIFLIDDDTAYFYVDPVADGDAFLFHEVAHQLFAATRKTPRIGGKGNFWITEGIACHFESLRIDGDRAEIGGVDNPRMTAARVRWMRDRFYVPLAELTRMSLTSMQRDPRLPTLYSQASGLADFLLYADDGRYREATVDYLTAVYAGRDTPTTLSERTGRTYAELDDEYRRYLERLPPPAGGP